MQNLTRFCTFVAKLLEKKPAQARAFSHIEILYAVSRLLQQVSACSLRPAGAVDFLPSGFLRARRRGFGCAGVVAFRRLEVKYFALRRFCGLVRTGAGSGAGKYFLRRLGSRTRLFGGILALLRLGCWFLGSFLRAEARGFLLGCCHGVTPSRTWVGITRGNDKSCAKRTAYLVGGNSKELLSLLSLASTQYLSILSKSVFHNIPINSTSV